MHAVGNIVSAGNPFDVLSKDETKEIWKRLSPDCKSQNSFLVTSKSNYVAVKGDLKVWELFSGIRLSYQRGRRYGLRRLLNVDRLDVLLEVYITAGVITSVLGLKALIPLATLFSTYNIFDTLQKNLYINGWISNRCEMAVAPLIASFAAHEFAAWGVDLLVPSTIYLVSSVMVLICREPINAIKKCGIFDIAKLVVPIFVVTVIPSLPLPVKTCLACCIMPGCFAVAELSSKTIATSAIAEKVFGTTYGTFAAIQEGFSWFRDLGFPKLKRIFFC